MAGGWVGVGVRLVEAGGLHDVSGRWWWWWWRRV